MKKLEMVGTENSMQADFDIVGNVNPAQANAELCNLISSTLSDCGLNKDQFTINVSNRKIVQGLIDELKISEEKQIKVIRAIDKLDKPGFGLKGVEDLLKKREKIKVVLLLKEPSYLMIKLHKY